MRFSFVWVGKTKDRNLQALQEEYLQRLSHFVRTDITEVKEHGKRDAKSIESNRIGEMLNQKAFVCVLDAGGKLLTSPELAQQVERWMNEGRKEITFVIGGAEGVSDDVGKKADFMLSLSFLTFTHEMARVVLLEQLYRAFTIIKGHPYQK
jgi:23S rRNA (pseudouridine1915-N3)-methyltransferase